MGEEERTDTHGLVKSIWLKSIATHPTELDDRGKINAFIYVICHSLMTIAEMEGWDKTPFEKACQRSLADNGDFVWYSPFKTNKSRSQKGRIRLFLDNNGKVPIVAEITDKKRNNLTDILIIDTFLPIVIPGGSFQNPTWLDNDKFGFTFLNSQLLIYADTSSGRSVTVIEEKDLSRAEIEGWLRQLTYQHFENDAELKDWANK